MSVHVFMWFDVEDYVTPQSDVALGRLVDIFDRHGLKATFKLVGEKVRGLERRGHHDILTKLRSHDVGYHTDFHSKPPSIPEYLLDCDWQSGIAEFIHREEAGLDTLKRVFRRTPSCYGQPGGSWAPHVYPALRQWGIPVYLDAGPWVGLNGRPHRYCDVLDMLGLDHIAHIGISGGAGEVERRLASVVNTVDRLRHTGGEISLYAHECEFVTQEFWDATNYGHGTDTPRSKWRPAPLLDQGESEERYLAMDRFVGTLASLPDVELVTASQAPSLYRDLARGRTFTPQEIAQACAAMAGGITHQLCGGVWLSPAEVFGLGVELLAARVRDDRWPRNLPFRYFDGPTEAPATRSVSDRLSLDDIYGTCLYESAHIDMTGQMPSQVQVGRDWLSPADFITTVGAALPRWLEGDQQSAPIVKSCMAQARFVPEHVPWGWTIFPPGFNADPLLQVGRLQAWTLKPAPLA
ncbi:MAG: hypothetical protein ISS56_06865 [Anaerolineae bacterium]|nr:hypothetical protein [Anaerolineae bacterium]